ncbi:hypothetical protein B9Z65_1601 [Elsinoe australis]|uniref:DNA/RNA-binding domain-containing protein n=1 Tax=Elsinoe australis TaxID=40998 RepID=A0A2P7YGC6_9PEZI|nr:hypothetical protein B9Z65_1601 [Elsinoe australis]
MALLYETVPLFEDVWTECLGDLARYRMAIENHSVSVREVWTDVARYWYSKASDRQPMVGRLYHHLGILARPNLPQQLFFYTKSLCCVQPFNNARHSIKAVFEAANQAPAQKSTDKKVDTQMLDNSFVRMHNQLYDARSLTETRVGIDEYLTLLRDSFPQSDKKWKQYGVLLAVSNMAACFSYGAHENSLRRSMEQKTFNSSKSTSSVDKWVSLSIEVLSTASHIILSQRNEKNTLPHLHVLLVLMDSLCSVSKTCSEALALLTAMPWAEMTAFLNQLTKNKEHVTDQVKNAKSDQQFIPHTKDDARPLSEDFALRGLLWCRHYFPEKWFDGNSNDDLPYHEPASSESLRIQRVLWLGVKISTKSDLLQFHRSSSTFSTSAEVSKDVSVNIMDMP